MLLLRLRLLLQVWTAGSSDLAKHYPGYSGGAFFIDGRLQCIRKSCRPTSGCKNINAPNGAVCDVNTSRAYAGVACAWEGARQSAPTTRRSACR
jgi:hypothetical protein